MFNKQAWAKTVRCGCFGRFLFIYFFFTYWRVYRFEIIEISAYAPTVEHFAGTRKRDFFLLFLPQPFWTTLQEETTICCSCIHEIIGLDLSTIPMGIVFRRRSFFTFPRSALITVVLGCWHRAIFNRYSILHTFSHWVGSKFSRRKVRAPFSNTLTLVFSVFTCFSTLKSAAHVRHTQLVVVVRVQRVRKNSSLLSTRTVCVHFFGFGNTKKKNWKVEINNREYKTFFFLLCSSCVSSAAQFCIACNARTA